MLSYPHVSKFIILYKEENLPTLYCYPIQNLPGLKIAPFKNPQILPYGVLANPAINYPISQHVWINGKSEDILWPSSEACFHGQKIIYLINKLCEENPGFNLSKTYQILGGMLNKIIRHEQTQEYLPSDYYALVNNALLQFRDTKDEFSHLFARISDKKGFDVMCRADYHPVHNPRGNREGTDEYMWTALQLKLEQYPEIADLVKQCVREQIILIEVSEKDPNWGAGPRGDGLNRLGLMLMDLGEQLLLQEGIRCPTTRAERMSQYETLRNDHAQDLSHVHLSKFLDLKTLSHFAPEQQRVAQPQINQFPVDAIIYNRDRNRRFRVTNGQPFYEYLKNGEWAISGDQSRYVWEIQKYKNSIVKPANGSVPTQNQVEPNVEPAHKKPEQSIDNRIPNVKQRAPSQHESANPLPVNDKKSSSSIQFSVISGFMMALGAAAIILAFTVFNAAAFTTTGVILTATGAAAVLAGIGLFKLCGNSTEEKSEHQLRVNLAV